MLGKRIINSNDAGVSTCSSDTTDIFGNSSGVALYSMDYDASDESGNYDGTPTDVEFGVGGHINYGAGFNGSSSYINLNSAILPASVFSVSFWVNVNSLATEWIFSQYTGGVTGRFIFNITPTGGFQINVSSTNSLSTTDIPVITIGNWHHVVVVKDGSNGWTLYADGQLHSTWTSTESIITNQNTILGGDDSVTANNLDGNLDQVRIFNSALNQSQVDVLYAETACVYTCTTDTVDYPTTNVAYYKLDNTAEDETGTYDGTATNVNYTFGRFGQAAVFNGSSSYIDTNVNFTDFSNGDYTVSMWVNKNTDTDAFFAGTISATGALNGIYFAWVRSTNASSPNAIRFLERNTTTTATSVISTTGYTFGQWIHVVGVRSGGTNFLYVNGTPQGSDSNQNINHSADFTIGRAGAYTTSYLDGSIDQVRIFSSALDATQVESLYNEVYCVPNVTRNATNPFGDSSELALYKFEDNANDAEGNYNGTASNVTYASGYIDKAAVFTNTSYINGTSLTTGLPLTFSFWVKPTSTLNAVGRLISKRSSSTTGFTITGSYSSSLGYPIMGFLKGGGYAGGVDGIATNKLTVGVWSNVVVVVETTGWTSYIDGVLNANNTGSITSNSIAVDFGNAFSIGNWVGSDWTLDQVRIFNRALDSGEVTALYNE